MTKERCTNRVGDVQCEKPLGHEGTHFAHHPDGGHSEWGPMDPCRALLIRDEMHDQGKCH